MLYTLLGQKVSLTLVSLAAASSLATTSVPAHIEPTAKNQTTSTTPAVTVAAIQIERDAQPESRTKEPTVNPRGDQAPPIYESPTTEQVREEIIYQANLYGVNVNDALRIAHCESTFRYNVQNPKGTAKGVYQFIDGTWEWIGAEGHQYDYVENIKQFMIWYQRYPAWWECK